MRRDYSRSIEDSDEFVLDVKHTIIANMPLFGCGIVFSFFIIAYTTMQQEATAAEIQFMLAMMFVWITMKVIVSMINNIVLEFKPRPPMTRRERLP